VLTHEDDELREKRLNDWNKEEKRINMASNASWSTQNGFQKPINAGKVDPYRKKQNELNSNVFEQTDYSHLAPMTKKKIDFDNIYAKPEGGPKDGSPAKKAAKFE